MPDEKKDRGVVGFSDGGAPIVLPEHSCGRFRPGRDRLLESRTCWYCLWADFRKTTDVTIAQSICRCPGNRVQVLTGNENETLKYGGDGT